MDKFCFLEDLELEIVDPNAAEKDRTGVESQKYFSNASGCTKISPSVIPKTTWSISMFFVEKQEHLQHNMFFGIDFLSNSICLFIEIINSFDLTDNLEYQRMRERNSHMVFFLWVEYLLLLKEKFSLHFSEIGIALKLFVEAYARVSQSSSFQNYPIENWCSLFFIRKHEEIMNGSLLN
jgi:hypothetical protein